MSETKCVLCGIKVVAPAELQVTICAACDDATRRPVHHFDSTHDAYDATQCGVNWMTDDAVEWFDILVCKREKVVGLSETWPIAITEEHGQLHTFHTNHVFDKASLRRIVEGWGACHADWNDRFTPEGWGEYGKVQVQRAIEVAKELGYNIRPVFLL